jgi:hypothetical protein
MMHYAGILNEAKDDQEVSGIKVDRETPHDWNKMVKNV